jgi:hypothetical protein
MQEVPDRFFKIRPVRLKRCLFYHSREGGHAGMASTGLQKNSRKHSACGCLNDRKRAAVTSSVPARPKQPPLR